MPPVYGERTALLSQTSLRGLYDEAMFITAIDSSDDELKVELLEGMFNTPQLRRLFWQEVFDTEFKDVEGLDWKKQLVLCHTVQFLVYRSYMSLQAALQLVHEVRRDFAYEGGKFWFHIAKLFNEHALCDPREIIERAMDADYDITMRRVTFFVPDKVLENIEPHQIINGTAAMLQRVVEDETNHFSPFRDRAVVAYSSGEASLQEEPFKAFSLSGFNVVRLGAPRWHINP